MLKKSKIFFASSLALGLAAIAICQQASAGSEPRAVVEAFHAALVQTLQAPDIGTRIAVINPAVDSHFDTFTIARISLGRNWRSLTPEQQRDYQMLIGRLIKTTYAARFDNWDDQQFELTTTEQIADNRLRVRSTLTTKSETVSLDYQLLNTDGDWRIYDVVANGVSDLSLKRSNYAAIFKQGGLAAVAADIEEDIAENQLPDPD